MVGIGKWVFEPPPPLLLLFEHEAKLVSIRYANIVFAGLMAMTGLRQKAKK